MSVIESVWAGLGVARDDRHRCWTCDATVQSVEPFGECVYCGSPDVRSY